MPFIQIKGAAGEVGRAVGVVILAAVEVFMFLSTPSECQKFTVGVRILWFEMSIQLAMWESPIIH